MTITIRYVISKYIAIIYVKKTAYRVYFKDASKNKAKK